MRVLTVLAFQEVLAYVDAGLGGDFEAIATNAPLLSNSALMSHHRPVIVVLGVAVLLGRSSSRRVLTTAQSTQKQEKAIEMLCLAAVSLSGPLTFLIPILTCWTQNPPAYRFSPFSWR